MLATTDSRPVDPAAAERKVVLLRLLTRAEATRLGLEPSDEEVKAMVRWWRTRYELRTLEDFAAWLRFAGMDLVRFLAMIRDFAALCNVQEYYAEAIDDAMDNHRAIHTVHDFISRKDQR